MSFFEKLNHQWWGLRTYYAIWILLFAFGIISYINIKEERIEYVEALMRLKIEDGDSLKQLISLLEVNGAMALIFGLYQFIPLVLTLILAYMFDNQNIKFGWNTMLQNWWSCISQLAKVYAIMTLVPFFNNYGERAYSWSFHVHTLFYMMALAWGFWTGVKNQDANESPTY